MSHVFVPMYDLDRLTDEQLHQYYLDACAYHGVPPELKCPGIPVYGWR